MKNLHNNPLYSSVATKKKRIERYLRTRMTYKNDVSHSLMVPVGASKFDYSSLILLDLICNQLTPISVPHNR